jgi:galactonate dehydratase
MPKITNIERIWVDLPLREIPRRNMVREIPHWTLFEICKVTLDNGVVGFGETMQYYTWGTVSDEAVNRCMEKSPTELMWDDSLGSGLQMALFDAVGKTLDVPCHHLLGHRVRDRAYLSWWDIDMPAEDWVAECTEAISQGYVSFKTKARPWFDPCEQMRVLEKTVPPYFEVDLDFNEMLNDTAHGTRVLAELEKFRNITIFESPIFQHDVPGNQHLRAHTSVPLALHTGRPPLEIALREEICDGFVVSGGATTITTEAKVIAAHDKIFWLQQVGSDITATWSLHMAAVLSHARWPAVNCHQLYEHRLLKTPIVVENGLAPVPEAPGLGAELDEAVVERFRCKPKEKPYPHPDLLIAIRWPSGTTTYYAHAQQYWADFLGGRLPIFPRGVRLEHIENDGSKEWKDLQQRAQKGAVHSAS